MTDKVPIETLRKQPGVQGLVTLAHNAIDRIRQLEQAMTPTIQVQIRQVYGRDTIYPHCDMAKKFAELIRQKTFTELDIERIKRLGYTVNVYAEPKTL
jgi:copper homeostasis protein CutC